MEPMGLTSSVELTSLKARMALMNVWSPMELRSLKELRSLEELELLKELRSLEELELPKELGSLKELELARRLNRSAGQIGAFKPEQGVRVLIVDW